MSYVMHIRHNVLNKLFGNCKLFGIDKHLQASFLSVYTNNSKENE